MNPEGKVALVTGGAQGIGLAIIKQLLEHGAKGVSLCDINEKDGKETAKELQREHGKDRIIFIKMDVADENEFKDAFKDTLKKFGSLDIVINNAGTFNDNKWKEEIEVNIKGVIHGNLLALKYMGKDNQGRGGVVVNMASVSGIRMGTVTPMYNATKHAVVGLTRSLGDAFIWEATGVSVMAICPGLTDTKLIRSITPESEVTYRKEWICKVLEDFQKVEEMQKEEHVGAEVVRMIREAKPGALWVVEDNKPAYEIQIPHPSEMKI